MRDDVYSLSEMARLADVTPRTIRYYIAQGLLPSPEPAGPATRYGDGHLLRLRLIRRLQRDHLPLAEIRARIERMSDAQVQAALDAASSTQPEPPVDAGSTLTYIRELMATSNVSPRFLDRPAIAESRPMLRRAAPDEFPLREPPAIPGLEPEPGLPPGPVPASPMIPLVVSVPAPGPEARPPTADRSTWERVALTPDVEIHVRRPLDRLSNKRVERLIRIARELFENEA